VELIFLGGELLCGEIQAERPAQYLAAQLDQGASFGGVERGPAQERSGHADILAFAPGRVHRPSRAVPKMEAFPSWPNRPRADIILSP
jgi:hypothetical protein